MKPTSTSHFDSAIRLFILLSLAGALLIGGIIKQNNDTLLVARHFPNLNLDEIKDSDNVYTLAKDPGGPVQGYVVVRETGGWGGPALVAVQFSVSGGLKRVVVLSHMETPVFFRNLLEQGFFEQFSGKSPNDPFKVDQDIDAVSGATVSSKAFTEAAGLAAVDLANQILRQKAPRREVPWVIGLEEYLLLTLLALTGILVYLKRQKPRKAILVASIVLIGFHMASPVSISNIGSLILGYLPPLQNHLLWWGMILAALLPPLLLGRNYYCLWLCPFGGLQELIFSIAGFKITIGPKLLKIIRRIPLLLLWLSLIIIFLSRNPSMGMFEPFATLFSFKGSALQWYLVSLTLFASFIIPRFWCRFFCPVGCFLEIINKLNRRVLRRRRPKAHAE